jgi:protein-L-isoaspartate(D-aspartate) O-methyltransferase
VKALLALCGAVLMAAAAPPAAERAREREMMVLAVENLAATAGSSHRRIDAKVLGEMRRVPRHLLVPEDVRAEAYQNRPLPIGYEATISQPYIVALMTDLLNVEPGHKVLEVGTGSGYQAAVLSGLVSHIYSIEIVEPLARRSGQQLAALGYRNVTVRAGDGYAGWPEQAPFDRIIVTAGADHVPQPLIAQLRPGGRMVIPVGQGGDLQLTVIDKTVKGRISRRRVLPVNFVPLVRKPAPAR